MYVVWLLPGGSIGFTGISPDAEICHGFPPPQAALRIILSNEGFEVSIDRYKDRYKSNWDPNSKNNRLEYESYYSLIVY